jgi:hypothetical protein
MRRFYIHDESVTDRPNKDCAQLHTGSSLQPLMLPRVFNSAQLSFPLSGKSRNMAVIWAESSQDEDVLYNPHEGGQYGECLRCEEAIKKTLEAGPRCAFIARKRARHRGHNCKDGAESPVGLQPLRHES